MGSTSAGKNARASWDRLRDEMGTALQLAPSNAGLGKLDDALTSSALSSIALPACQLAASGFFNPFDRLGPVDLRPSRWPDPVAITRRISQKRSARGSDAIKNSGSRLSKADINPGSVTLTIVLKIRRASRLGPGWTKYLSARSQALSKSSSPRTRSGLFAKCEFSW